MILGLTRLVNLTSACLNQQHTRVVGSGCKVITQDADNLEQTPNDGSLDSTIVWCLPCLIVPLLLESFGPKRYRGATAELP